MSAERFTQLVTDLCNLIGIPDAERTIERGSIEVEGHEVLLQHFDNDLNAMYLNFSFGIVTAGRTHQMFQSMLESNLTVYAQDQAQLGVNPNTGGLLLIIRVPMTDDIDGNYLVETFQHYTEHGRYWRETIVAAPDQEFAGVAVQHYMWVRA